MRLAAVRLAAVLVAWACVQPLPAWAQATVTWNGATDTTWSQPDTTSWSGATYSSGDTAVFAGSGTGTVTITAGGVTPGQTNVTGGSYTFSGGPLGGSGGIAKGGSGTLTLTGSNSYSGTTSIAAGVLNIQNASALGGTAAGTTVASAAALQIQGGITVTGESLSLVGGGIASDGALRNISGTNTWTGGIAADGAGTVQANGDLSLFNRIATDAGRLTLSGPIQIAAPAGSGTAAAVLLSGNGDLVFSGNIAGGKAGNISFVSSSVGTGTRTLSGSNTYLGWTVVNGNTAVEGAFAIPDASRVVMSNPNGRLVLNASETIGGLASVAGTQINLNSHTLTIGADNTTPLSTDLGGATYLGTIIGTGGIVKVGTGVLTLSASNSYSGGTTLNAGMLSFANNALGTSGAVTLNSGTLRWASGNTQDVSGRLTLVSGSTATLDTNGNNVTLASGFGGSTTAALTKVGSGTLTLSAATTYTGTTSINAGTLALSGAGALASTGAVNATASGATLDISGITAAGLTIGSLSGSAGSVVTLGGKSLTVGNASSTTFAGGIGGSGGIAKSGAGMLTLTGSNSYSGTTSIGVGVLNIQNASALGGTAAGTTVASAAALQIQGGITVLGESLSLVGGGGAGDGALRNISGSNTWTGAIGIDGVGTRSSDGDVTPHTRLASDAGLLTLSGPIQIAAPAAPGSATAMLVQGFGNVAISGNIAGGKAGSVSFVSSSVGTGTRTLSGSNTYLGWTVVNGNTAVEGGFAIPDASRVVMSNPNGRLVLNASETIGGLTSVAGTQINLNSHTLTIGADNITPLSTDLGGATYLGTIIGTGGIVKVGTGVLTLSASNSYSGSTVVNGGTLALGLNGSFANSPTITIGDAGSSGAVLDITAKTGTFTFSASQAVGGIGTLKMDAGDTARLAGTFAPGTSPGIFTFDGGTALLAGTTQIEIFGAARGTGYDAVDLINSAVLNYSGGSLLLDFGSTLAAVQSYQLFGDGSPSLLGSFSSLTIAGSNYTGLTFTGSNGVWTSQGTSPADQTLTFTEATGTLVIVPEPGALALAGIGVATAIWTIRRRK